MPKVESLVEKTKATVEQSGRQITEITTRWPRTNEDILDSTKSQLAIVEDVVGELPRAPKYKWKAWSWCWTIPSTARMRP